MDQLGLPLAIATFLLKISKSPLMPTNTHYTHLKTSKTHNYGMA